MTLKEFADLYDKNVEYEVEIVEYIPYKQKVDMCKSIIGLTTNVDPNYFEIDSSLRNVLYKMTLISIYTDIEIDLDNYLEQYDIIESKNMMSEILDLIPYEERRRFDVIMECLLGDLRSRLTLRRNG